MSTSPNELLLLLAIPQITGGPVTAPFTAAFPITELASAVSVGLSQLAAAGDTVLIWGVADPTIPAGNSGTPGGGNAVLLATLVGGGAAAMSALPDATLPGWICVQRTADSGAVLTLQVFGAAGPRPYFAPVTAPAGTAHSAAISLAALSGVLAAGLSKNATAGDTVRVWGLSDGSVVAGPGAPPNATALGDLVGGAPTALLSVPQNIPHGWVSLQRIAGATSITVQLTSGASVGSGTGNAADAVLPTPNTDVRRDPAGIVSAVELNGGAGQPAILRGAMGAQMISTTGDVDITSAADVVVTAPNGVGIGIDPPTAKLHVKATAAGPTVLGLQVEGTPAATEVDVNFINNSGAGVSRNVSVSLGGVAPNNWVLVTDLAKTGAQALTIQDGAAGVGRFQIDSVGRVAVSTAAVAAPATGTAFDVQSGLGGLGFPFMTNVQEGIWAGIAGARKGIGIWNTDLGFPRFWTGTALVGAWITGGQLGGAPLALGTNDNNPLNLRANAVNLFALVPGTAINSGPTALPVGAGAGQAGRLLMQNLPGSFVTGWRSPDALAASVVYTMPGADASLAGQGLASNAAGVLSWANFAKAGGNTLGAPLQLGETDGFPVQLLTSNLVRLWVDVAGRVAIGAAGGTTTPDNSAVLDLSQNNALGLGLPIATRVTITGLTNPLSGLTMLDATNKMVVVNLGSPLSPVWARVSGGPNVAAGNSNGQSIPNGVSTVVLGGTGWSVQTNTGGNFNASSGVFTAPVPGFYEIEAALQFVAAASAVATEFRVEIVVTPLAGGGPSAIRRGVATAHSATAAVKQSPNVEIGITLAAGDQVTINAFQNSGAPVALTPDATVNYTCFALVQ